MLCLFLSFNCICAANPYVLSKKEISRIDKMKSVEEKIKSLQKFRKTLDEIEKRTKVKNEALFSYYLKEAIDIILIDKKYDVRSCFSTKVSLKNSFGVRDDEESDYPLALSFSFLLLESLCN